MNVQNSFLKNACIYTRSQTTVVVIFNMFTTFRSEAINNVNFNDKTHLIVSCWSSRFSFPTITSSHLTHRCYLSPRVWHPAPDSEPFPSQHLFKKPRGPGGVVRVDGVTSHEVRERWSRGVGLKCWGKVSDPICKLIRRLGAAWTFRDEIVPQIQGVVVQTRRSCGGTTRGQWRTHLFWLVERHPG